MGDSKQKNWERDETSRRQAREVWSVFWQEVRWGVAFQTGGQRQSDTRLERGCLAVRSHTVAESRMPGALDNPGLTLSYSSCWNSSGFAFISNQLSSYSSLPQSYWTLPPIQVPEKHAVQNGPHPTCLYRAWLSGMGLWFPFLGLIRTQKMLLMSQTIFIL